MGQMTELIQITLETGPIPCPVVQCPECQGETQVEITEWATETGIPTEIGVNLSCVAEDDEFERAIEDGIDPTWEHRWWQVEWQPAINKAVRWAMEHVRVVPGEEPISCCAMCGLAVQEPPIHKCRESND